MLGALAAYSITVKELRQLFRYLKGAEGQWVCIHNTKAFFHQKGFHSSILKEEEWNCCVIFLKA